MIFFFSTSKTTSKIVIFWTIFLDLILKVCPLNVFREFSNFHYVLSPPETFSKQLPRVHTTWENCAHKYDRNMFWISGRLKVIQCRSELKEKRLSKSLFFGLFLLTWRVTFPHRMTFSNFLIFIMYFQDLKLSLNNVYGFILPGKIVQTNTIGTFFGSRVGWKVFSDGLNSKKNWILAQVVILLSHWIFIDFQFFFEKIPMNVWCPWYFEDLTLG